MVAGQPNHLIVRANNRRRLFSYPRERLTYLRLLSTGLRAHQSTLHAICLMTNHVHLLLTPASVAAGSACLKQVNQRYAQIRNGERGGSGKLFEERFHSAPIQSEGHLAMSIMYIEANPHRACIRDAAYYPWSSWAIHAGAPSEARIPADMITLDPWYRQLGVSGVERARVYRRLFEEYLASGADDAQFGAALPIKQPDTARYAGRLLRPDGSSAAEPSGFYVLRQNPNDDGELEG